MNPNLTPEEGDACLEILHRGLVRIRMAGMEGNAQQAEAVADALHNLPRLLSVGHEYGWDLATFKELFLAPLCEKYPDLAGLSQPLEGLP